jgi:hypothetical protein
VRQDWNDYGPLAKVVAFHDIASDTIKDFWAELKREYRTEERIDSFMGIGIVYREKHGKG